MSANESFEQAQRRAEHARRVLETLRSERDRLDTELDAGRASFRQLARVDHDLRRARLRVERAAADAQALKNAITAMHPSEETSE